MERKKLLNRIAKFANMERILAPSNHKSPLASVAKRQRRLSVVGNKDVTMTDVFNLAFPSNKLFPNSTQSRALYLENKLKSKELKNEDRTPDSSNDFSLNEIIFRLESLYESIIKLYQICSKKQINIIKQLAEGI